MNLEWLLSEIFSTQVRVFVFIGVMLLVATELGFLQGRALFRKTTQEGRAQISAVQGSVLGLLALLLGFSFSMAANRYEQRRALVLDEANAIQGCYVLAGALADGSAKRIREDLRLYVDARLEFAEAGSDQGRIAQSHRNAEEIQEALMEKAMAVTKDDPNPLTVTVLKSLNDSFDYEARRTAALRQQVPAAVWILVLAVAAVGVYVTGYAAGCGGVRTIFSSAILPVLITLVITLISDLDRARLGVISVSQQPMIEVKESISGK